MMTEPEFHDCLERFFERMYPDIALDSISFREGLPFYTSGSPHAITVGRSIYFDEGRFDPCNAKGLALIAHELFHIQQGAGGPGFWFMRPFYVWYFVQKVLSGWKRGRQHPVEIPAYERQDRVAAVYGAVVASTGISGPCGCSNGQPGDFSQAFTDAFYTAFERPADA